MTIKDIPDLDAAGSVSGADYIPVTQGTSIPKRLTTLLLSSWIAINTLFTPTGGALAKTAPEWFSVFKYDVYPGESIQTAVDAVIASGVHGGIRLRPGNHDVTAQINLFSLKNLTVEWMPGAVMRFNFGGASSVMLQGTNIGTPSTRGGQLWLVNPWVEPHPAFSSVSIGPVLFEKRFMSGGGIIGRGWFSNYRNNTSIRLSGLFNADFDPTSVWGSGHMKPWKASTAGITFSITSGATTLTSSASHFTASDVGKTITLFGGGAYQKFTISAYVNVTTVTVSLTASSTFTAATGTYSGVRGSIAAGSAALTMEAACLVASDVGRSVVILNAYSFGGGVLKPLRTTILSVDSASTATLAANATATVSLEETCFSPAVEILHEDAANLTNDFSWRGLHLEQIKGLGLYHADAINVRFPELKLHGNNANTIGADSTSMLAVLGFFHGDIEGEFEGTPNTPKAAIHVSGGYAGTNFKAITGSVPNDQVLIRHENSDASARVRVGPVSLYSGSTSERTLRAAFPGVNRLDGPISTYAQNYNLSDLHYRDPSRAATQGVFPSTADCRTLLQAAITAQSNGILRLDAGTYTVNLTSGTALSITSPIVIEGEGDSTILNLVVSTTTFSTFFAVSGANVTFRNLKVLLTVPATGEVAMFQPSAAGFTLQNVTLDGAVTNSGATVSHLAYGILLPTSGSGVSQLTADKCRYTRLRYPLLKANASTSAQSNLKFLDSDFYNNYNEDLSFNSPNGSIDGVIVRGCSFRDGNGAGASINQLHCAFASVTNFLLTGCSFRGSIGDAVHIEEGCIDGTVSGNVIEVDNASTNGAIQVTDNNIGGASKFPENIAITGNTIRKNGTQKEAGTVGINLVNNASAEVPAKRITVTGNTVKGFENGIISALTPDDSNVIAGNISYGCTNGLYVTEGGLSINNNVSDTCDVGIYSSFGGAIGSHNFINCTTNIDAAGRPMTLMSGSYSYPEFAVGAGASVYSVLHGLGVDDRFYGHVTIQACCENSNDFSSELAEVTWDGTTFTATTKAVREAGTMAVAVARNTSNLTAQVFCGSARTTVRLFVRFNGMMNVAV